MTETAEGPKVLRWPDNEIPEVSGKTSIAAALSFGILEIVLESDRLAGLNHSDYGSPTPVWASVALLCFLGGLIALRYLGPARKAPASSPALPLLAALLCSLGLASMFYLDSTGSPAILYDLGRLLHAVSGPVLLYFWAQRVIAFGRAFALRSFGAGAIVIGALGMLVIALEHSFAMALMVLLPVVGIAALSLVDVSEASRVAADPPNAADPPAPDASLQARRVIRLLIKLLPFVCYAIMFGNVHYSWVAIQDGGLVNTWIQLGASLGSMLCGLGALALASLRWRRALESIANLLLAVFAIAALWLSTLMANGAVFFCLVLLNVAHKFALMLMLLYGFLFSRSRFELAPLGALSYLCFQTGMCVSGFVANTQTVDMLNIFAAVAMVVVIAADLLDIVSLYDKPSPLQGRATSPSASDSVQSDHADDVAISALETTMPSSFEANEAQPPRAPADNPDAFAYTCHRIALKYDLTRREEEILQLIVRGRSASRISETLSISTTTTRTHFRNIYAKLDVHSQQDVLDLYEAFDATAP